ncbi:MAG: ATPase [Prevotella sp.]|nr:ATPase [Candidatus Equicola faecalis]
MDRIRNCRGMILIADSGSTKTDWILTSDQTANEPLRIKTQGINPVYQSSKVLTGILQHELLPFVKSFDIEEINFYGSGCRDGYIPSMQSTFHKLFPYTDRINIHSDLLGAARALCRDKEGIACILGTGSNSCLYDGEKITYNVPSMGYILGDEGSGAVLGRELINALFKGCLKEELCTKFCNQYNTNLADIINKVYHLPLANRLLASFCIFIKENIDDENIKSIVIDNFRKFFIRNIRPYRRPYLDVNCCGSIAYFFQKELAEAAQKEGFKVGNILRSPIEALVCFHTKQ